MLQYHKDRVTDAMLEEVGDWQDAKKEGESEDELASVQQNGNGNGSGIGNENSTNGGVVDMLSPERKSARDATPLASPARLPPIGNFAISPSRRAASRSPTKR